MAPSLPLRPLGRKRGEGKAQGAWTAISRVPYLKAITLFAKGDCWNGGGLFLTDKKYWLNDGCGHTELHAARQLQRDTDYLPPGYYGGECLPVYYNRLQRDGWKMHPEEQQGADVFEKPLPKGWILRKYSYAEIGAPPGKGCYWDAHELWHPSSETRLAYPEWEWADLVGKRLVWATEGQLMTAGFGTGKLNPEKVIYDFMDMAFGSFDIK